LLLFGRKILLEVFISFSQLGDALENAVSSKQIFYIEFNDRLLGQDLSNQIGYFVDLEICKSIYTLVLWKILIDSFFDFLNLFFVLLEMILKQFLDDSQLGKEFFVLLKLDIDENLDYSMLIFLST
jgi:hypothetical protein